MLTLATGQAAVFDGAHLLRGATPEHLGPKIFIVCRLVARMGVLCTCPSDQLFWIVDHGSSHRGATSKTRLPQVDSQIIVVPTPVHASWLEQVAIYCSLSQRKVLTPNDFTDLEAVRLRLPCLQSFRINTQHLFSGSMTGPH